MNIKDIAKLSGYRIGTVSRVLNNKPNVSSKAREEILKIYGKDVADCAIILYGGSVKPSNAKELFKMSDIDGGLIGGASLNAKDFANIVNYNI